MDLSHMQSWFPTAGYNLQAAHKLRRVYSPEGQYRVHKVNHPSFFLPMSKGALDIGSLTGSLGHFQKQ